VTDKAPSPSAPILWILSGLACFCIGIPLLCCGLFFRVWEPEDPTVTVRIYDLSLTKPDMNSLQNLIWDKMSPNEFWLERMGNRAQIGFLANDGYHLVQFDPSNTITGNELEAYYKRSQKGSEEAGSPSPPRLSVNITQSGEVHSPFYKTSSRIVPTPKDAKFLNEVE